MSDLGDWPPKGWREIGDGWVVTPDVPEDPNFISATKCAEGDFQARLINGLEALSLSTLKGRAKKYPLGYAQKRDILLRRLDAVGVAWSETRDPHNRRILCIGTWLFDRPGDPAPLEHA